MLNHLLRRISTTVELTNHIPPRVQLNLPRKSLQEFVFSRNKTVQDLVEEIAQQDQSVRTVQIKNQQDQKIEESKLLADILGEIFYIEINNKTFKILPGPHLLKGKWFIQCREQGISFNESFLLSRYINTLYKSLPENFTKEEYEVAVDKANEVIKQPSYRDIETLQRQADYFMKELEPQEKKIEMLKQKAEDYAQRVMSFGVFTAGGQLATIGYLTFGAYGWDVMEPVAYMVGLSWGLVGFVYFLANKQEFEYESFRENLVKNKYQKLLRKNKINLDNVELLKRNLAAVNLQIGLISKI